MIWPDLKVVHWARPEGCPQPAAERTTRRAWEHCLHCMGTCEAWPVPVRNPKWRLALISVLFVESQKLTTQHFFATIVGNVPFLCPQSKCQHKCKANLSKVQKRSNHPAGHFHESVHPLSNDVQPAQTLCTCCFVIEKKLLHSVPHNFGDVLIPDRNWPWLFAIDATGHCIAEWGALSERCRWASSVSSCCHGRISITCIMNA